MEGQGISLELKMNSFHERFFSAVFASHAGLGHAQTFCHLQKSSSMATLFLGNYKQF